MRKILGAYFDRAWVQVVAVALPYLGYIATVIARFRLDNADYASIMRLADIAGLMLLGIAVALGGILVAVIRHSRARERIRARSRLGLLCVLSCLALFSILLLLNPMVFRCQSEGPIEAASTGPIETASAGVTEPANVVATGAAGAATDAPEPSSPSTYLFDTGATAADPMPATAVAAKKGWKVLAEDDTSHKFAGDTVLLNDRLVLVLRGKAAGAELYAQGVGSPLHVGADATEPQKATPTDMKKTPDPMSPPVRRAAVAPVGAGGAGGSAKLSTVRILENNPGAVMVEAGFQTDKGLVRLTYRLTTGQTILELRPGEGVQTVRIDAPSRYVAVPDFFGDDMIFTAGQSAGPRLRLPTENFLLHFVEPGGCLLMCVWPSSRQQAAALVSGERAQRAIQGSEIDCAAGKSLWIAVLEGPGLWHEQAVSAGEAPREMVLDWKPPFPAKWRATLAGSPAIGPSWYFRGAEEGDEVAAAIGDRSPCCLEAQRALFQVPTTGPGTAPRGPQSLVVYPIDRTRGTPLTTFCPIDILRATLGVGPCQYILQTEGLASDANPTPDSVMTFVEKQFAKKKEKQSADEMRQMLAEMVGHVGHAQQRIDQYAALARDVRAICQAREKGTGTFSLKGPRPTSGRYPASQKRCLSPFLATLDDLERKLAGAAATIPPAQRARKLADEVLGLIGQKDAAAECRRLGLELRRLGAVQDRGLANGRMAARWLRQQAAMLAERDPGSAVPVGRIEARIEQTLRHGEE
jgi:hypothetical protein